MSTNKLNTFLSASLKAGVALLPLTIAFAQMSANAQPKTKEQLESEAAAAKAAAQTGADADDAAAAAQLFGGLTGTSKVTENTKDIVVTGTNIRGVAPTGTNLTVITSEDIAATGQMSTQQLLTTIPGFSSFNGLPNSVGGAAQGTTAGIGRPNLRGTPDGDLAVAGLGDPGSSTLILIDGNRQSGGGIRSTATDPETISPSLLERVEINTDGGSASYGSEAIGGVVNFVTRKRYNGTEVSARLGYADDYWQYDATALAGKDWGSGSAYISGNYSYNTPLYRGDRDYLRPVAIADGLQVGLNCDLPNISIASTAASGTGTAFVPAIPVHYYKVNADGSIARTGDVLNNQGTANLNDDTRITIGTSTPTGGLATSQPAAGLPTDASRPNLCTLGDRQMFYNKKERYGVSVNFFQKITDNIDLLARASYAYLNDLGVQSPLTATFTVTANNPWRQTLNNGANGTGTGQAIYPIAQPGFPTPINDVLRPCTGASATVNATTNPVPCAFNGQAALPTGTMVPVAYSVLTNLSQVYGDKDAYSRTWNVKFGGNAELTWRIDGNWQAKATGIWDRTTTYQVYGPASFGGSTFLDPYQDNVAGLPCTVAVNAFAAAGGHTAANSGNANAISLREAAKQVCVNPYNPETSNPAILARAHNFDSKTRDTDTIKDFKVNLDGALLTIPGGKIRVAVGGEYEVEDYLKYAYSNGQPIPFSARNDPFVAAPGPLDRFKGFDPALYLAGSKWIWSAYAELNIPLVSRANELTWVKEFRISLQGRYDKFKTYGQQFNPKIGVSFKPTNWLGFHGNYNTSFRAPGTTAAINNITIGLAVGGAVPVGATQPQILPDQVYWSYNQGGKLNLKPTTGESWSVGLDLTPFRGFRASVSYQHIDYHDTLLSPNPANLLAVRGSSDALASVGLSGLPGQGCNEGNLTVILDQRIEACTAAQIAAGRSPMTVLTDAQIQTAKQNFVLSAVNAADVLADPRPVYALVDGRFTNAGNSKIGTLDYSASYVSRTPWGSVNFSVKGTVLLIRKAQSSDTAPFINQLTASRHSATITAGFAYGPLRVSANVTHSDGYRVTRSAANPQDRVGDFNLTNLFASWDFKGDNVVERGLQLTLSINNILNTRPPVRYTGGNVATANGSTLGRLVQAGFTKKF